MPIERTQRHLIEVDQPQTARAASEQEVRGMAADTSEADDDHETPRWIGMQRNRTCRRAPPQARQRERRQCRGKRSGKRSAVGHRRGAVGLAGDLRAENSAYVSYDSVY